MTELEAIKSRHSIRKYKPEAIAEDVVAKLREEISRLNKLGNLNMQLVLNEPKAFKSFLAYGKFSNVENYVMIVGKKSENLDYRVGYYAEQLVLFAQCIGLNTCMVGLTYKKVDGAFNVKSDEKVALCIAIGYGAEEGRSHKIKTPQQVSNVSVDSPQWFVDGVESALLAPTAVNQQKFSFEYIPPKHPGAKPEVKPVKGNSLVGYTKMDLGIAMFNFEVAAGKENFDWVDSPLE